jgi:hypothetical protein
MAIDRAPAPNGYITHARNIHTACLCLGSQSPRWGLLGVAARVSEVFISDCLEQQLGRTILASIEQGACSAFEISLTSFSSAMVPYEGNRQACTQTPLTQGGFAPRFRLHLAFVLSISASTVAGLLMLVSA